MKAEFHYDSEEVTVSFRVPLADKQKLWKYQIQYPDAVLTGLEGDWEALEELAVREGVLIREESAMKMLSFLDAHLDYLCASEQTLYRELLKQAQTLSEALELAVNLDCYQIGRDGVPEQIQAHTCPGCKRGIWAPVGRTGAHQMKVAMNTQGTYHWLYLPMTEEKKLFLADWLSIEQFGAMPVEPVEIVQQSALLEYLPEKVELERLETLADLLVAWEDAGDAAWNRAYAALSVERPETVTEVCQVIERSTKYALSEVQEQDWQYQTPYGYLDLKGALPLHPLPKELVTTWIYGRLYGEVTDDGYGMEDLDLAYLYGEELCDYEAEIRAQVKQDQADMSADGGLAQYIYSALLRQKVRDVEVSVAAIDGTLWSKTRVESYGALNQMETEAMKEYLLGQFADGWGEGFSQREIAIHKAQENLYLYFWHSDLKNVLYTEEELQELLATPMIQLT